MHIHHNAMLMAVVVVM